MEDHHQATKTTSNNISTTTTTTTTASTSSSSSKGGGDRTSTTTSGGEPVRSRWTPKPEQILILESIFNSGMVNPPKEETVRIRKLLEKFGAVGDANVFYWFQNRRSRSRRRQRQLQASLAASVATPTQTPPQQPPPHPGYFDLGHHRTTSTCTIPTSSSGVTCFAPCNSTSSSTTFCDYGGGGVVDDVFGNYSGQMDLINSNTHQMDHRPSDSSNIDFQSGIITVFLNGVATQVPGGAFDMKAMFGEEVILVHSSGVPVPFNEFGISLQSLQHGESYFLVPRIP